MLHLILASSEAAARRRLHSLLVHDAELFPVAQCPTGAETVRAVGDEPPDVLLLSLQLRGTDAREVAEAIPAGSRMDVVLLAARAGAADQLPSASAPGQGDGAARAPGGSRTPAPYLRRLVVRSSRKMIVVDVDEIERIEAEGDYLRICMGPRSHLYRGTISALGERLDPAEFVRVHRSALVRVNRIRELAPCKRGDYLITLTDGAQLRMSRTYRPALENALGHPL